MAMSFKNKHIKAYPLVFLALICSLLLALSAFPLCASTDNANSNIVRIGYFENEVFQEGAQDGAVKSGYAYEYYRKISEYTGWKYEYVYGSFGELFQKLLDGEIDLLAGLAWTQERALVVGYPDMPMGHETYYLARHDTDESITTDPASFSGRTIGVLDSAIVGELNTFLEENNVQAAVVTFSDYQDLFTAFDTKQVDMLAAEGDGAYGRNHAEMLCPFGASDYYLCVNKKRPDLLEKLNVAQTQLTADEPNYLNSLELKYYPVSISSRAFSEAEKEWLKTHDTLSVGYLNHYLPFSDTDAQGNAAGIVQELVPELFESLGISGLEIKFIGYDDYDAMTQDMAEGIIELAFPVGGDLYYSEESGLYQSYSVTSTANDIVFKGSFSEESFSSVAVNENNRLQYYIALDYFPDKEMKRYTSIEECLDAVLSGKADCTIINSLRASDLLKNSKYRALSLRQMSENYDHCFGVEIGNEGLLKIVNRGLHVIGSDYAQNLAYKYTDGLYSYTAGDFIRDNLGMFAAAVLAVAAIMILFLFRDVRRTRNQVRDKEIAREILEAKNEELEQSRRDLAETDDIIAAAGFGVWHIILEDGREPRMRANPKMMELLGIAGKSMTEEEVYDAWYSRVLPEEIPSVQKSVGEMLEGRLSENTYRWEHPEKGVIYVRCGGTANIREEKLQMLRGYHSDVTELVREDREQKEALSRALSAAEHASRAKTEFLNNMSHDIRTPMNAIVGFTSLASAHIENKEQVKDYLDKIAVSSRHLLSLINDVLDMSRIESGKMTLDESQANLPDIIHDLRTIIQASASAKQLKLFFDTQDVVDEVISIDKLRLNQVFLNILSNAIKFTPNGGKISFSVIERPSANSGYANYEFRIKDTGIGMSKEFQKTIFEAFTRERSSTVSGIQGTGLGMAITKNIVDMIGGTIQVNSEAGEGTEFVVDIPCKIGEKGTEPEPVPELIDKRVLVADDDTNTCLSVCSMLRKLGMRPDWTNYGREAVVRAKEALDQNDGFHTYIIDWLMPDMNGIETIRQIRRVVGDGAQMLILTAYDWADIEAEAREAGVTDFCSKPLFLSELRKVLSKTINEKPDAAGNGGKVDFTGKHVLLAEDNEMNQMIAEAILTEYGFTVDIASDGEQTVQRVRENPAGTYDVILMDIQMPKMNGYEAAKRIRQMEDERKAGIPIAAVTANAFEEDRRLVLESGMDGHLAKPYDIQQMIETLTSLLGKH